MSEFGNALYEIRQFCQIWVTITTVRKEDGTETWPLTTLRCAFVQQSTNAILHPWLQRELTAILKHCPPAPEAVPEGRCWQDWDIYPAADQLDRFFPPVRILLIWDNLAGNKSHSIVQWCAKHGILLLSTPNAGSWLNMAESVQRIIKRRALQGYHRCGDRYDLARNG